MKLLASFRQISISFVAICGYASHECLSKTVTLVAIGQTNPPKQT